MSIYDKTFTTGAQSLNTCYPNTRHRRLRQAPWIRDLVQECHLTASDLILPLFIFDDDSDLDRTIPSLPGVFRHTIKEVCNLAQNAHDMGIHAIALFPCTPNTLKSDQGQESINPNNLICRAIRSIKSAIPEIGVITDIALDPYTTHGHDGIVGSNGCIDNDQTLDMLCKQSLNQASAGADVIAPSDMMDGRIGAIRSSLEKEHFVNTLIMSYAAKYASYFYGPFRDAVGSSSVLQGDKKTYQMNPANASVALHEVRMDIAEGADMVMVKPGLPYLDIIKTVRDTFQIPTFGYHVSGEYAMLKAGAEKGWVDYDQCLLETLTSFKRSGCTGVFTYGALDAARLLNKNL